MKAKLRTDLTIVIILSIACMGLIGESVLENWEFWMGPLLFLGITGAWVFHITQYSTSIFRETYYLAYGMVAAFFHGVHETSFFDIVVVFVLLMLTFTLLDNVRYIRLIISEYVIVMMIQFMLAFRTGMVVFDPLNLSRILLHLISAVVAFLICQKVITDRQALNNRLMQKNQEIEASDIDMENFLTNISHELRTPVNVVNGMSTLILQKEDSHEVMAIRDAGLRMSHQIEDIQDYTEIDRREVVLEMENYMITSLVNDVVAGLGFRDTTKLPEIIVDLDATVPVKLYGDYKKLQKILRHLIDNAIKFTHRGGIYIRIVTFARDYGVNLSIEVRDTGVGMSKAEIDNASEGLYQANKERNRNAGGIGLGLNIVSGFVHKMDGFVKIESEPGVGTKVRVSIPQSVIDPRPCISMDKANVASIIIHIGKKRFSVAQVRDFYKFMAGNLAEGVDCDIYPSSFIRDIEKVRSQVEVSHIFTLREEYFEDKQYFDEISKTGIVVAVATEDYFEVAQDSRVILMNKPLYGYTISKIINDGHDDVQYTKKEEKEKPHYNNVKALIVDDEPMNLVVATGLFRDYGMITDTADSGIEAVEKYAQNEYDIIFMDHMMPVMDGVEAMKQIRKKGRGAHQLIVALTANAVSGAREMFISEGFDGFIAKPINVNDFERVMKRLLGDSFVSNNGGGR